MRTLIAVLLVIACAGCTVQTTPIAPSRPASVPEKAIWVGGEGGGVFVVITATQQQGIYTGTVYFDTTGERWYQGAFAYSGDTLFAVDDVQSYDGWDGNTLYLSNNERLIAIDPVVE